MPQTLSHIPALSSSFVTIFSTGAHSRKADTLWPFPQICRCCPSCLFRCLCILSVVDAFLVLCLTWVNILYPMCIQQIFLSASFKVFFCCCCIHYLHFFVAALLAFRLRYVSEEKCSFNKVHVVAFCFLLCEGSSGCVLKITARDWRDQTHGCVNFPWENVELHPHGG